MRIIIIGPAYPFRGGIADTDESLCRAFNEKGHEASIVTFTKQYPSFLFPGKTQFSTDPAPADLQIDQLIHAYNPLNWSPAALRIKELNPDLVIVRYWLPFMGPCLGTIAKKLKPHTKLIALCDNVIPHEGRIGDVAFTRYFTKQFDGFMTLSHKVEKELDEFTTAPTASHPHPINDGLGSAIDKEAARTQLGLDPTGKYLLFFGLIRKYKGLDLLLDALANSNLKDKEVQLLVVGEFYDEPKEYHDLIEKHGLKNRVIIHDSYVATADLFKWFSASDLVTQTYRSASQSGVTQLAFNFDRPILVTDVGGLAEVVRDGENGYVSSLAPSDIASKIQDFFEHDRSAVFSEAVVKDKVNFSWGSFVDAILDLNSTISR